MVPKTLLGQVCVILGVSGLFWHFHSIFDGKVLLANNIEPDQVPYYVTSDLGLHYLPMTLLWVFW